MANLSPDTYIKVNGVMVKSYLLTEHNPNRIDMPSKRVKPLAGVTIHNTGAIKVSGTTMAEQYTRATRNGNMNSVRVHYYVDDKEAWQNLPLDWQGWHAADGNGDGNTATIAIECIGQSAEAEDNTARLAAWLLKQNGMGVQQLYTHTYWLNVRDGRGAKLSKDEAVRTPASVQGMPDLHYPALVGLRGKGEAVHRGCTDIEDVLCSGGCVQVEGKCGSVSGGGEAGLSGCIHQGIIRRR